ncbi:MAG TPA: hypothetical protein VHE30_11995 [Polyangiaceae bacterium]|nr:hypothetical protein [Polyangiaceae bacterium]
MTDAAFDESMARLETLLEDVERRLPGESADVVRALVETLLTVHRLALADLLAAVRETGDPRLVRALVERPSVESVLLLHGLHPETPRTRVEAALAAAHRAVATDAHAEIVAGDGSDFVVRVRGGTAAAAGLLRRTVERLVTERAPDVALVVEGGTEPDPGLVPLERLLRGGRSAAE